MLGNRYTAKAQAPQLIRLTRTSARASGYIFLLGPLRLYLTPLDPPSRSVPWACSARPSEPLVPTSDKPNARLWIPFPSPSLWLPKRPLDYILTDCLTEKHTSIKPSIVPTSSWPHFGKVERGLFSMAGFTSWLNGSFRTGCRIEKWSPR